MKTPRLFFFFILLICSPGCTTWQLTRSTLAQGKTFTDIQYSMVLDNIAMFKDLKTKKAVPWHLTFSSGDITIKDTLTGGNPNFSYTWDPISRAFGASASRSWQENWTAAPVVDGPTLNRLMKDYAGLTTSNWIQNGRSLKGDEAASGYYNLTRVWVSTNDLALLTEATLQILADASASGMATPSGTGAPSSVPTVAPLLLPGPTLEIR